MEKFKVIFSKNAGKDMDVLSDEIFSRIIEGCKRLEDNPMPDGKHVKKLKGYEGLHRLRVGDYRVVFERMDNDINIVRVLTRQEFGKKY